MYGRNIELLRKLKTWQNIGDSAPNYNIVIKRKNGEGGFESFPFKMKQGTNITVDRRYNMSAGEVNVTLDNNMGILSPDYSVAKTYPNIKNLKQSGYKDVILPFNSIEVDLGYGNELRRVFTGQLQKISINEENSSISIDGKDIYRKLLKPLDPITKRTLRYENKAAWDIIKELLDIAGVTGYIFDMETIAGKDFTIPSVSFELGSQISDCLTTILDTMDHRCYVDRMGILNITKNIYYAQNDFQVAEIDDFADITQGEYTIDPSVIRNRVIVQSNDGWQAFEDPMLINYCNGERIACGIESPWAITEEQRWAVADAFFLEMRRKLRRPSIVIKGDPTLDVGDLVKIQALVSTMNSKYMITGIKSTFGENGYFDTLDLEFVTNGTGHLCEIAEGSYEDNTSTSEGETVVENVVTATLRDKVVNTAMSYQGTLYQWGGNCAYNQEHYGMDCSHFTYTVYKKHGLMATYMNSALQYANFNAITREQLLPGDLVFYSVGDAKSIHHVGIYVGDGKVISASGGGPRTTSASKAKASNAYVKVHNLTYMNENYFYARPSGL